MYRVVKTELLKKKKKTLLLYSRQYIYTFLHASIKNRGGGAPIVEMEYILFLYFTQIFS